jgi:UDP-glucuronate 4-epimerase
MKVLVTGVAGFIGMHVAQKMMNRGDAVIGIDNLNDYYDPVLKYARLSQLEPYTNFQFEKIDVADRPGMAALFKREKVDCVVHLAGQAGVRYSLQNPHAYVDSNLVGFVNVLEGCRHHSVHHLVYASSSSVYGGNTKIPFSEADPIEHPISLYAATKKANELMAHSYSHLYGLPSTGLRFFTVYGPWGRPDMAYYLFTKAILEGESINVFNHGKMQRDFTYVDDIVEGVLRVLDKPPILSRNLDMTYPDQSYSDAPYRVYNIGNHQPVELMAFIETIEACLGIKANKNLLPIQPGDVVATFAETSLLRDEFGFTPSTPLEQGISTFIEWFLAYHNCGRGFP